MSYKDILNNTHPLSDGYTPQSQPLPGQISNAAGGHYYEISIWDKLDRFLIIGSESGTYYVNAKELTAKNIDSLKQCIKEDGIRVVSRIFEISQANRAPKKDSLILSLAVCMSEGNLETKHKVLEIFNKVIYIGTDLLMFCNYVNHFRGWGKLLRKCVANWFLEMDIDRLALQVLKYNHRNGWTLRDALRLAHPKILYKGVYETIEVGNKLDPFILRRMITESGEANKPERLRAALFDYICKPDKKREINDLVFDIKLIKGKRLIDEAFVTDQIHGCKGILGFEEENNITIYTSVIDIYNLPREALDTSLLKRKDIWQALLKNMPEMAMLRNLGKMTAVGLLEPFSENVEFIVNKLNNAKRLHPIKILMALLTYQQGHGMLGDLSWNPNQQIMSMLNKCFYNSFNKIKGTGERILIAIDISGSMQGEKCVGSKFLNCLTAAAAMLVSVIKTEPNTHVVAFDTIARPVTVTADRSVDDIIKFFQENLGGGTDISSPIQYALKERIKVDAFIIFTDNETWHGDRHASQALEEYRNRINANVKMICISSSANDGMVCDPNDKLSLGIAGFDASIPELVSDFIGG